MAKIMAKKHWLLGTLWERLESLEHNLLREEYTRFRKELILAGIALVVTALVMIVLAPYYWYIIVLAAAGIAPVGLYLLRQYEQELKKRK